MFILLKFQTIDTNLKYILTSLQNMFEFDKKQIWTYISNLSTNRISLKVAVCWSQTKGFIRAAEHIRVLIVEKWYLCVVTQLWNRLVTYGGIPQFLYGYNFYTLKINLKKREFVIVLWINCVVMCIHQLLLYISATCF